MKIIDAGYSIYPFAKSTDMVKRIEEIARVCYKSEDKITEVSAERMVNALVTNKHYAMLEHGYIVMELFKYGYLYINSLLQHIKDTTGKVPKLNVTSVNYSGRAIVSGNMRAWLELMEFCKEYDYPIEEDILKILLQKKYSPIFKEYIDCLTNHPAIIRELEPEDLTDKEKMVHSYISVKFIVDRGISHEIVRHRDASFAQESTRYCNYGKDGDVTFIRPCYFEEDTPEMDNWLDSCMRSEKDYLYFLETGRTPQEARGVLHTSVKTEVVMTATPMEWIHFCELRALGVTGKPHPQMEEVAIPLLANFLDLYPKLFMGVVE